MHNRPAARAPGGEAMRKRQRKKGIYYYMEAMKFDTLQLDERILRAVTEMGFEEAI